MLIGVLFTPKVATKYKIENEIVINLLSNLVVYEYRPFRQGGILCTPRNLEVRLLTFLFGSF